jgi:ABC-2 type transport system ATP-binding protein
MQTIYSTKKLGKQYSSFTLHPFDLTLELGKVYGVVGENAAGKTTLLRLIAHDLLSDSGDFQYFFSEQKIPDWEVAPQHIAYITQELPDWKGKLYELVIFSAVSHGLIPKEAIASTEQIMLRLGISELGNRKWSEISGGYKLRFALAAALVWHPKLLVMDEPLANLDVATQHLMLECIKALAKDEKHPMCVVISSQHLVEIENISDDLIYVENGKLLFSGNKQTFGADRNENVFELNCNIDLETLQTLFANEKINITKRGYDFVITSPLSVNANYLFKILIFNNVEINYFRNISQSSKKMFIHE